MCFKNYITRKNKILQPVKSRVEIVFSYDYKDIHK